LDGAQRVRAERGRVSGTKFGHGAELRLVSAGP
jgi:hypothetical protein